MRLSKIATERGVTLLEVLVSMLILTISLLLLMNMAMIALDANDWSNKTTRSVQLMQDKIEELRGTMALTGGTDTVGEVVRNWRVASQGSFLRRIDVQAVYTDINGDTISDIMTTYVRVDTT